MTQRIVAIALLLMIIAACRSDAKSSPDHTSEATPPRVSAVPSVAVAGKPDAGPTAEQTLVWVLQAIERGGIFDPVEIERRFSKEFLASVPMSRVQTLTKQFAAEMPPLEIVAKQTSSPLQVRALLRTKAGGVRVSINMTPREPRQIAMLRFQPAPVDYAEVETQLQRAGAESSLFVAELSPTGTCRAKYARDPDKRLAIGSTFKLWVLLATDATLAASNGNQTWTTKLPIRDDLKSLPSGVLQDQPAGTEFTVREFAEKMISISDNTATDHLIAFAGRTRVEDQLAITHHSLRAVNSPLFTTRELFAVKLIASDRERAALRASRGGQRRARMEALAKRLGPGSVVDAQLATWSSPKLLEFEWFASAIDVCNAMATIAVRSKFDPKAEMLATLSKNPGLQLDRADWSYAGFKGGSEPGVLNLTQLLQRKDGTWFVIVATINDPNKMIDESIATTAIAGAAQLLAVESFVVAP